MNRRNFLRNGSLAGFTIPALMKETAQSAPGSETPDTDNIFKDLDLNEVTIEELQQKMQTGELTSKLITQWYLKRIDEIDKDGPKINSVIEVNPDAITIAEGLDTERKNGKVRGPLHGIPVLIKDNIDTADKMMTTAGSLALAGNIASKDAFIVKLLRESGAVLLGKTNLSEFANFRSIRILQAPGAAGEAKQNVLTFSTGILPAPVQVPDLRLLPIFALLQ
ncbi:MAG: amidase family protein [Segetibacter sp.]